LPNFKIWPYAHALETDSLLSEQWAIPEVPVAASKSALLPLAHKEF
jgi:hypothetical protein